VTAGPRGSRRGSDVLWMVVLIGSVALAGYERLARVHHLPKPSIALLMPGGLAQASVYHSGLHLVAIRDPGQRRAGVQWRRLSDLGRTGYQWGWHLNALGFAAAFLPRAFVADDYVVLPHAALAIPLWLTGVGSLAVLGFRLRSRLQVGQTGQRRCQ